MTTQFTPGPWFCVPERMDIYSIHHSLTPPVGWPNLIGYVNNGPITNAQANARLIAAAPDLLAALQELVALPNKHRPEHVWQAARDAIAKAMGEGY